MVLPLLAEDEAGAVTQSLAAHTVIETQGTVYTGLMCMKWGIRLQCGRRVHIVETTSCCHVSLPYGKVYPNRLTLTSYSRPPTSLINQGYECICVNALLLWYVGGNQGRKEEGGGRKEDQSLDRGDMRLGVLLFNGQTVSSLTKSH